MTKRDFFKIIIKLLGLYAAILTLVTVLPNFISMVLLQTGFTEIFIVSAVLIILFLFLRFLLFKSNTIIDRLDLDKGFDDDRIELGNFKEGNILMLAIVILGGVLIIN